MANPITWKNVNQPNFGAANSLLLGSTRTMSDAFSNLSDRFINQGEYNKEKNTGEAIAAASQLDDLNSFGSDRQNAMAALLGKNIDQTAVAAAYDDRRGFLQDNVTFGQQSDAAEFEAANRADKLDLAMRKGESDIASATLNRAINAKQEQRAAYAATPEAIKAANKAKIAFERAKAGFSSGGSGKILSQEELSTMVDSGFWGTIAGWTPLGSSKFENMQDVAGVLAEYEGISKAGQENAIRRSSNNDQIPSLGILRKELEKEQARAALKSGILPTTTNTP